MKTGCICIIDQDQRIVIAYVFLNEWYGRALVTLLTTKYMIPIKWRIIVYEICNCIIHSVDYHYSDVRMGAMASQITSLTIVYSTVYSGADKKHQSSASLAFVRGIHRWLVNSPHKWPVTHKMFQCDDVIMQWKLLTNLHYQIHTKRDIEHGPDKYSKWSYHISSHVCCIFNTLRPCNGLILSNHNGYRSFLGTHCVFKNANQEVLWQLPVIALR